MKNIVLISTVFFTALAFFSCGANGNGADGDNQPKTAVTLDITSRSVEVGGYFIIRATAEPKNSLTWSSSNSLVATVNSSGRVDGISQGTATITAAAADGGNAACSVTVTPPTKNYTEIEGDTLVHYVPKLVTVYHFGGENGTDNADNSYTFNGTAAQWSGGGAQYTFPAPRASDSWTISDYTNVDLHITVMEGNSSVILKKYGQADGGDLVPVGGSQYYNFSDGNSPVILKFKIEEAGLGIGFQRNNTSANPATIIIDKAVFSK